MTRKMKEINEIFNVNEKEVVKGGKADTAIGVGASRISGWFGKIKCLSEIETNQQYRK